MKKLFFTALVAVAAIGGAYAQYSSNPTGGAPTFNCVQTPGTACSTIGTIYFADGSGPIPPGSEAYTLNRRFN